MILKIIRQCAQVAGPLTCQAREHLGPATRRRAVRVRIRRKAILSYGRYRDAERACSLLMCYPLAQPVDSLSEIHVCTMLDKVYAVGYTITSRAHTNKAGEPASLGREMPIHPPLANRPQGRCSPKVPCWTAEGKRIGGHGGQEAAGQRARTCRAARLQRHQAREGPLVGGARSAGRAGVRDGLQARRGRGGAPGRGPRS